MGRRAGRKFGGVAIGISVNPLADFLPFTEVRIPSPRARPRGFFSPRRTRPGGGTAAARMPPVGNRHTPPDHFSAQASAYARCRPHYPAALFEYLAAVSPGRDAALDVGTGSGQAALALAGHFGHVRATDRSIAQLACAPAHPRIEYVEEAAEEIGTPPASFDLVTVAQAAHWFDLSAFYGEVRRVLRPGGVIALWTYGLFEAGSAVDAIVGDFYRNVVGPYWPRERYHVEDGYRSLPFPFTVLAAPAFRIETSWTAEAGLGYLGTWSAVLEYRRVRGKDPLGLVAPVLRAAWGQQRRRVTWPLYLRAGRVCGNPAGRVRL